MLRVAKLFERKEPLPAHEIEAGRLSLRIFERPCGHPGHSLELYARLEDGESILIGVLSPDDFQPAIMLLQEGLAWSNDHAALPRRLQTTWLWGATYFVDERLGELRRTDDPSDRVPFARP